MKLKKLYYSEYLGTPRAWELMEFTVNDINLIVGTNASGKTRTLNVIAGLGKLLLNSKIVFQNGIIKAHFLTNKDNELLYHIQIKDGSVQSEEMYLDNEQLIGRSSDGTGFIKGIELDQNIKFQIPLNELAAIRRDDIQHPFLNYLFEWSSNIRHFRFAKEDEKRTLVLINSNQPKKNETSSRETDQAIAIFRKGEEKYGDQFKNNIIDDFNEIGYSIENIYIGQLESIQIDSPAPAHLFGLLVKERDLNGITDQNSMSDGMFRALSIIIHFNYYQMTKLSGLVLIDDIGEGLDFDRSTKLIKLLINKSNELGIQLIMSTNDKFVMNNTKLEYWQIVHRDGQTVNMYNITNSAKIFDQYKYTGLNNFDFFSSEFFKAGFND